MAIGGPVPADSIVPDWSNGENVGGSFNKKRVTVEDKASATDINELRAIVEGLIGHTHGEYLAEGETDPNALEDMRLAKEGYYILPGGLILQWGIDQASTNEGDTTHSFPIAFTTTCFMFLCGIGTTLGHSDDDETFGGYALSTSQFKITKDGNPTPWFAIGI